MDIKTYTPDELRVLATKYKYKGILVLNDDLTCVLDFINWVEETK